MQPNVVHTEIKESIIDSDSALFISGLSCFGHHQCARVHIIDDILMTVQVFLESYCSRWALGKPVIVWPAAG